MKIKKLTMKAFGSYGDETTLDYADLQDGLYLIRGKTGAGKTTIFDAVMIALYGEASGERRDFAMFHSDFVPKSVDSEVVLEFEHQGRTHKVRRVQHFRRPRGTEDEYVADTHGATFWEDGKPVIENKTVVTNRITELIGLTAAQFRQIVMLAQGDFRKFLDAKSDERCAILRQIFDTGDYRGVTERLCAAYGRLKGEREEEERTVSVLVENMAVPDDASEEEKSKLTASHPQLLETLEDLVARETTAEAELRNRAVKSAGEHMASVKIQETAKIRNDQLKQLADARDRLAALQGRKEEMTAREVVKGKVVRALPAKRAKALADEFVQEVLEAESELTRQENEQARLKGEKESAEQLMASLAGDELRVAELDRILAKQEPLLKVFDELKEIVVQKTKVDEAVAAKEKSIGELEGKVAASEATLGELKEQIEEIGNPEKDLAESKAEKNDCSRKLRELQTLQEDVDGIERSIADRKASILARACKMLGVEGLTWEDLVRGERIRAAQNDTRSLEAIATEKEHQAAARVAQKTQLMEKQRAEETRRTGAANSLNDEKQTLGKQCAKQAELNGQIEVKQKLVGGLGSKDEFSALLDAMRRERRQKKSDVEQAQNGAKKAQANFGKQESVVETLRNGLRELRAKATKASGDRNRILAENGYVDGAALDADLAEIPAMADEKWLADETSALTQYANDVEETSKKVSDLAQETEGCVEVDLEELEQEIEKRKAAAKEDVDAENKARNLLDGHRRLLESVRSACEKLARTEMGWKRLGELVGMVNGAQGQGADRLDFERYMLGANLREVLAMANQRLDVMSGGRYELVHRVEGLDQKGAAGLDIDVLDHVTGARRQAGSFSGGEGFQASMALALGLSDVVKNHAGSSGLDSTFIDEGFGSLDGDVLENCVRVLKDLAGGNRQVGIISHVEKLEEDIWPQIVVEGGATGSTARIEKR